MQWSSSFVTERCLHYLVPQRMPYGAKHMYAFIYCAYV